MLFFHRVVHMWGQPPARGAEGRCRAAAGLWTTRSGPAVGEEVHSLCVHALPQAVTGVGKQVFHRPRGPVGAGIPPVDQDLPGVPNPVDNQGREGRLSTGGCGQPWGGVGEGAWGQSWGQSGDNLGAGSAPRRGGAERRGVVLQTAGPGSAPRRGGGSRWGRVRPPSAARDRTGGSPAAGRARGSGLAVVWAEAGAHGRRRPARSGGGRIATVWTGVDTGDTGHVQPGVARDRTGGSPGLYALVDRPAPDRTCSGSHRGRVGGI